MSASKANMRYIKGNRLMGAKSKLYPLLALVAGLAIVFGLYMPGMSASVMFDTQANLANLADLSGDSLWTFIFSGQGGPLGRPIALATFALQADSWPHDPAALRTINVVIHTCNAFLIGWLGFLLARSQEIDARSSAWAATLAALLWASSPLLASTNLFIIQRMTSLSLLFVLAGIIAHLHLRRVIPNRPMFGYILLSVSLIVFTATAILCKENGALLPGLILIIEAFLLNNRNRPRNSVWFAWKSVFLAAPMILIAVFILSQWNYGASTVAIRDFSAYERLLTQAVILWEYLFHALVPAMHRIGPFHDQYPVYRSILELPVILALVGWMVVITAAIALRRNLPLITFAVAWYLWAHVIESTVLPLELYFEHRNYLALVGPAIALCLLLFRLPQPPKNLVLGGAILYLLLCSFVLARTTALWGVPLTAADFWHSHNPESSRATLYLTDQLIRDGDVFGAMGVLQDLDQIEGESGFVLLQETAIRCFYGFDNQYDDLLHEFDKRLNKTRFSYALADYLPTLVETKRQASCDNYDEDNIIEMARIILEKEHIVAHSYARYALHGFMGSMYFTRRSYQKAIPHLYKSLKIRKQPQNLFRFVVSHIETRQYELGCQRLEDLRSDEKVRIYTRQLWNRHIDIYQSDIAEVAGMDPCQPSQSLNEQ